ncbi:unnamed protein product, partial [Ectocarpus sp. 12 AP-2014]
MRRQGVQRAPRRGRPSGVLLDARRAPEGIVSIRELGQFPRCSPRGRSEPSGPSLSLSFYLPLYVMWPRFQATNVDTASPRLPFGALSIASLLVRGRVVLDMSPVPYLRVSSAPRTG